MLDILDFVGRLCGWDSWILGLKVRKETCSSRRMTGMKD